MLENSDESISRGATGGLTADDVVLAYRMFFDREPESAEIVAVHMARHEDLKSLRAAIIGSQEFRAKLPTAPALKPLNWPPIRVDVDVSASQLAQMVRLVEANWEMLGRSEPHWSVLTNNQYKSAQIGETEKAFYQTGEASLQRMTSAAARCGVDISALDTCLELGCGVGRVTFWLAKQFDSVIGVDISRSHLLLAESAARQHAKSNIRFIHADSLQSLLDMPSFDCFYSIIVFQHNPPPVICAILSVILGKLNPGGVAYFQIPTYKVGYRFNAEQYLRTAVVSGHMEMHVVPQTELFKVYSDNNCRVLEVREDGSVGTAEFISTSFFIQKNPRS